MSTETVVSKEVAIHIDRELTVAELDAIQGGASSQSLGNIGSGLRKDDKKQD